MSRCVRHGAVWIASLLWLLAAPRLAHAQSSPSLTQLQFDIVGARLVVDPPVLTVPKNIATQINTSLTLPAGAAEAREALAALTQGAVIEAELRGPSLPATRFTVQPGQPIPLPAFALPGDYVLDNIRLVKDGEPILGATAPDGRPASTIPIKVISDILVASVTSRPLSLDEIKSKGIVIDETNFKTVNFQVAFNIDGQPFTIDLPAALPTPEFVKGPAPAELKKIQLAAVNRQLTTTLTKLPPQLDRPGLNFSIAALPFFPVLDEGEEPGFEIPPITGLVVIPGNVAFLNQFFSVMLMVTNVAPDGTPLTVRGVTSTISLPPGLDRQPGTYDQPGDDPLRLARIEGVGQQPTLPVVQVGPDGKLGTADDLPFLAPQKMGQAEFLVEGLKEGGHTFDLQIRGTLEGLPSGPVEVEGLAAGAVFVRNPSFSVSLAHPRTIRAGEKYDLYATVTNTSKSVGNLVSVSLDPFAISGAQLISPERVSFETIGAGQAATAKFTLIAQQTGEVTFSSFTGDVAGDIRLVTGVGERGIPLAPNAIVLPKTTDALPPALVAAAQRVLGQAYSIATAPAEALPPGVLFVKRQTVIDRGVQLAEAGQRVQFGEPVEGVLRDLALDWLGNGGLDEGFDQLVRTTEAGAAFRAELARAIGGALAGAGALDGQRAFAQATVSRDAHLSAIVGTPAGAAPVALRVSTLGGDTDGAGSAVPTSGFFGLVGAGGQGSLVLVGAPQPPRYVVEAIASETGTFDLGVVIPGGQPGTLTQLRFPGVTLDAGGVARLEIELPAGAASPLQIDRGGDGTFETTQAGTQAAIVDGPPQVVGVKQLETSFFDAPGSPFDPATYGLLVGVLFDKRVTKASAETKPNYAIDGTNSIIGASLQPGGRLAYLYLQKPIGQLIARQLTVSGVADERGNTVASTTHPITTVLGRGGRVFGQVRNADGTPVGGALLRAVMVFGDRSFNISAFFVDEQGRFDFDFIPSDIGDLELTAQHPTTRELARARVRLRAVGDSVIVNPTFFGKGAVRGRVLAIDGVSAAAGAQVALFPGSVLGSRGLITATNDAGEFTFADVPVGVFTIRAVDSLGGSGIATGVVQTAGSQPEVDVVLVNQPDDSGRVVGRVFQSDGVTPASGFPVYIGTFSRQSLSIGALDQATTDATGSFAFAAPIPAQGWAVVAVDPATGQIGVAQASVVARTTTSVSIVLEATGFVEGVVFDASGRPKPGAVVAGGVALVETDANGRFRLEGVPAGSTTIEAGDPVTKKRGSAVVNVVPGQVTQAAVTLEARATIRGRVLDASGNPVPFASVRIPLGDGFLFVIANSQGVYTLPDLNLGDYLIQAPGPSKDSLISFMEANGYDPCVAFTSGDGPGCATAVDSSDVNAVIAAYQKAVQTFFSVSESLLGPPPMADLGGFGWTKVRLFQDGVTVTTDVKFLPQGVVAGRTLDAAGRPTGALTRVQALKVSLKGFPQFGEIERKNSDAATGEFEYRGIARFDQTTFQTAGVRGGDFTIEAATPFSPTIARFSAQLNTATPDLRDIVVQFPGAAETNGTVSGTVVMPDGVTPAPAGTAVRISFGDLTVTTDATGTFRSVLPIPAGSYSLTAQTPSGGLRGQAFAAIPAGGNVDARIQLLGLGAATVEVRRPGGVPVAGASVTLRRATFPNDQAEGTTDAAGRVRFVNLSEGPFSVEAVEPGTGLSGRANGALVRDGEVTSIVTITASGAVTGSFRSPDGARTIPFAQVTLRGGGIEAYASTDANGRFALASIPVGSFVVEASDPLTGRLGRASGLLVAEGQAVEVTILQLPRGSVSGFVFNADGVTRIPAATVSIRNGSFVPVALQAVTGGDGSFRFEGVSAGAFTLTAEDPVSGAKGTGSGTLASEGETVAADVVLAPVGTVRVTVRDAAGAIVTNANVSIGGRTGAVDATGQVTFENLPLGDYTAVARSLADSRDAGQATTTVDSPNQVIDLTVGLRGVGAVTVRVEDANGAAEPSAEVVLDARGGTAGQAGPGAASLNGFTDGTGSVTFPSVPVGDFTVRARARLLAGANTGVVATPGQAQSVTVRLGAAGSVSGRVLLPGGTIPAAGALVTIRFGSQGTQPGVLQLTTGLAGTFEFSGIPVGAFRLEAFEVVSQGVRILERAIPAANETVTLGDVVLDNEAPRVIAVVPGDGSSGAPAAGPITITFNESIDPATVTSSNFGVFDGATRLTGAITFVSENRTVVFTPAAGQLKSGLRYTVSLRGAPDGPRDASNIALIDPFASAFTVADSVPPVVVATSPAAGGLQVLPEATIRVTFSEAVAGAAIALRDGSGQAVPGTLALTLGNTVAVFSPADFLQANTTYTVTVAGVADLAGNPLVGGAFQASFATVDTIAPLLQALQLAGTPRAGAQVTLTPTLTGSDVARVEYLVAGTQPIVSAAAPFAATFTIPVGATTVPVTATAIDAVGNRSSTFAQTIAVEANLAPVVQMVNVTGDTVVAQGQAVSFDVTATDDVGLAQVVFTAVGGASASETVQVSGTQVTRRFTFTVPTGAEAGAPITVQAAATDTAGTKSTGPAIALTVRDGVAPAIAFVAPLAGDRPVAGQALTVTVDVSDRAGVASVALQCTPAAPGCETRTLASPLASTRQTFNVTVPAGLVAPATFTLLVSATDPTGNVGQAGRALQVADTVAPTTTAVEPVTGSTRVLPGQVAQLRANVADNVGVTAVEFSAEGAVVASGSVPVSPAVTSGPVPFGFAVPAGAPGGGSIVVTARARDAAGNVGAPATLTLTVGDTAPPAVTFVAPAAGSAFTPGSTITVQASASDDVAVASVKVTATGALSFTETKSAPAPVTPLAASFAIPVPAGAPPGPVTITLEAFDTAGNASVAVTRSVAVSDTSVPVVSITSPAGGTFDPASPLTVTVQASDNAGVAEIRLAGSGAFEFGQARAVQPPATPRTETFTVTFTNPPVQGARLSLRAFARDAAGNEGASPVVQLDVADAVAPAVTGVDPADGATGVATGAAVQVSFSEAVAPASLTASTVKLTVGQAQVAAQLALDPNGRRLVIQPSQSLAQNTVHTLTLTTGVTDLAGNPLAAPFTSSFRTISPDTTGPKVSSVDPAANTVGAASAAPVTVTFTEAVDRASVTAASFKVSVDGAAVPGAFAFLAGDAQARFTPSQAYGFEKTVVVELTGAIRDTSGNALVNADGTPVTTPITSTFLTGNFAITSPAEATVLENSTITIEAQASSSLAPASVVFSVNGTPLPADTAAPFSTTFNVPSAATASLAIVASARNAANAEVARAEKVVTVVTGLKVAPTLLGVPRGATRQVTLSLAQPLTSDLSIALSSGNAAVATVSPASVSIPAGQTSAEVTVTACSTCPTEDPARPDEALGNTAIIAASARGTASAVVSVSDPVAGRDVTAFEQVGASVSQAPSLGYVLLPAGRTQVTLVQALGAPAATLTPVTVSSSNPAVAVGIATPVQPGEQTASLTIEAVADGVATITLRAGSDVRAVTVIVGTPPAGFTPLALAPIVGASVVAAPSVGQVVFAAGQSAETTVTLLSLPHVGPTPLPVTVTSSQPGVATASASPVAPGSQVTTLSIAALANGTAELTLRGGDSVRSILVVVGTPTADRTPPVLALPVGASVTGFPFVGKAFVPAAQGVNLGVLFLPEARQAPTTVTVTSNRTDVVAVTQPSVSIPAGQLTVPLALATGAAGSATLTMRAGDIVREFEIVVGSGPTPSNAPVIAAMPVGASVVPLPGVGRLAVRPGAPVAVTLGVPVVGSAAASDRTVTVTTSDATVVSLGGGGSSVTLVLPAGATALNLGISTSGATGVAVLTIEVDGVSRELLVVVGDVPASQQPALSAPVIGVKVG